MLREQREQAKKGEYVPMSQTPWGVDECPNVAAVNPMNPMIPYGGIENGCNEPLHNPMHGRNSWKPHARRIRAK